MEEGKKKKRKEKRMGIFQNVTDWWTQVAFVRMDLHSLVQSRTLGLVAGEPREDVAVVSGPQRRGGGGSVAISRPDKGQKDGGV